MLAFDDTRKLHTLLDLVCAPLSQIEQLDARRILVAALAAGSAAEERRCTELPRSVKADSQGVEQREVSPGDYLRSALQRGKAVHLE